MTEPPVTPKQLLEPSALKMGWAKIPAIFCVATKIWSELIQQAIESKVNLPHHRFEEYMVTSKEPKRISREEVMYSISIYLDNLIGAAVENAVHNLFPRDTFRFLCDALK